MGGRSNETTTTTTSNEPSQFIQPHLTNLFSMAGGAINQVNRSPFGGDLYAGPTDAQLIGQNMALGRAANSSAGQVTQNALGQLSQRAASNPAHGVASAAFQMPNRGPMPTSTPQQFANQQFQYGNAPVSQPTNTQQVSGQALPQFSLSSAPTRSQFSFQEQGPQPAFNFQGTNLAPSGVQGGATSTADAVQQVAGTNPAAGNSNLQAAISAGIDPLKRTFMEDIMPEFRSQLVGNGAFDNSRAGFSAGKLLEERFSRPANEIAQGLIAQDFARQQGEANQNFRTLAGLGAQSNEAFADRQLQDSLALRGQELQQNLTQNQFQLDDVSQQRALAQQQNQQANQLGFQDVSQLRSLDDAFTQQQDQLRLQDVGQRRELQQDAATFDAQAAQASATQLNDIQNQQFQLGQQLGFADIDAANNRNLSNLSQLNDLGQANAFNLRGEQGSDFRLGAQLGQQDLSQRRNLVPQMLDQELRTLQAIPGMEQAAFQLGLQPAQTFSSVGAEQQGFNQGFLDEALRMFQLQNEIPFSGLPTLSSIIQGQPFVNQSTTQTAPGVSQGGQAIQGGIGGAATGFSIGGPVGAGIGGALGLLGGLL